MCRLLKVSGHSLSPEYEDGDFVLVSKIPVLLHRLAAGDVIAFHQAGYGTLIKLIEAIGPDGQAINVTGTHPASIDSRRFGPISRKAVIGKVIAHIHQAK